MADEAFDRRASTTDAYTKIALTVIAVALAIIAGTQVISPASARMGGGCSTSCDPCYVRDVPD